MRLIDANKYCDFLNTYPLEKAQNNFMSFYRDALQNTYEFEVKAIPVEWIKRKAFENPSLSRNLFYRLIIEEWEKENETDRR